MTEQEARAWLDANYPAATLDDDPEWVEEMVELLVETGELP